MSEVLQETIYSGGTPQKETAYFYADQKILKSSLQFPFLRENPKAAQQRNPNTLPPSRKNDGLEADELGQWRYWLQPLMSHVVELHQAIQGPHLTEVQHHCYVRIPMKGEVGW